MTRNFGFWSLGFATLICVGVLAWADEPASKPEAATVEAAAKSPETVVKIPETAAKTEEAAKDKAPAAKSAGESTVAPPPTHTVKKGPLKITLDIDGIFEATTTAEIFVKPEEWNGLTVESAAAHGARVSKGDVILTLDTKKIDIAIADLRTDLKLSEISIAQSEDQLRALDKTTPLDLNWSQRASRIADEERKSFFDIDRPFMLKSADFSLKSAKDMLEYEKEELHQLEKMYKADDITEETEEIVLKRARDSVEKAQFMVDYATLNHDETLIFTLPRMEETIKDSTERKSVDWEKNKIQLPLALNKQQLELEKLRTQRQRVAEKLEKLVADRELMTVKSPIDGIVYYGKCVRGKFSDSTGMGENLRRNGSILPNQVVMTIVEPRPMIIRASATEEQLNYLRPNLKGIATPTGYPDLKLDATVDSVSDVPTAPGSFDTRLNVVLDNKSKLLMPGMTCKVKFTPYVNKEAISVPPKCVIADELDDQKFFVYVLDQDGKPKKCDVKLGKKTDKQAEILEGLAEGDKVLLEAPKDAK